MKPLPPMTPGCIGERWTEPRAPYPSESDLFAARRSPVMRERVDRQLAEWSGLPADEIEGFMERLRLYDLRERARELHDAREAARHAALREDLTDYWAAYAAERAREAARARWAGRRLPRVQPRRIG